MAIVIKKTIEVVSAIGTPSDNINYDEVIFNFKCRGLIVEVSVGVLEMSMLSKGNPFFSFDSAVQKVWYINNTSIPKIYLRNTGATFQLLAWADA